ncbi:bone marrow proteoglycan [Ciconia maguari]
MQPCLLLVLALLGTASASHLAPANPEAEEEALDAREEDIQCPLESETRAVSFTDPLGATTYRYVIVTRCQTFRKAERICARCYRGRLASIHTYKTNIYVRRQAQLCTTHRQVWIGATTQPQGGTVHCKWADRTSWNYSYWLRGYPLRSRPYCTTLCINNGHWRSLRCRVRLPFVCEY